MAVGCLPYRDFTWQYPPLGIVLAGAWVAIFGASMLSFQLFVAVVGMLIALVIYATLRCLGYGAWISSACVACAVLASGVSAHQRMFSLNLYTPAALVALLGSAVCLLGLSFLRRGSERTAVGIFGVGATICVLSKVEVGLTALMVGALVAAAYGVVASKRHQIDSRETLNACAAIWLPPLLVYFVTAVAAGPSNLIEGLVGYGVGSSEVENFLMADLWRQTLAVGLPVFGISSLIAWSASAWQSGRLASPPQPTHIRRASESGRKYAGLFVGALTICYVFLFFLLERTNAIQLGKMLINSGMFVALGLFVGSVAGLCMRPEKWVHLLQEGRLRLPLISLFGLVSMPRGFIWGINHFSNSPTLSMFYWLLLLLLATEPRLLGKPFGAIYGKYRLSILLATVCGISILNYYALREPSARLETRNDIFRIPLAVSEPLRSVIEYVETHTRSNEGVVSAPYGSGMNFLVNRPAPLKQTQFVRMEVRGQIASEDLQAMVESPPSCIVVQEEPYALLTAADSRARNPKLWAFVDEHYRLANEFKNEFIGFKILVKK